MPLMRHDASTNQTETICTGKEVAAIYLNDNSTTTAYSVNKIHISADSQLIMFAIDVQKLYRHSSFGTYLIYDNITKTVQHVAEEEDGDYPQLQITLFAQFTNSTDDQTYSTNYKIAYVQNNDVHTLELTRDGTTGFTRTHRRITNTADDSSTASTNGLFKATSTAPVDAQYLNGVGDWCHEEEVMGSDQYIWWNTEGTYLAFATFDQELVPVVSIPHYDDLNTSSYPDLSDDSSSESNGFIEPPLYAPTRRTVITHTSLAKNAIHQPVFDWKRARRSNADSSDENPMDKQWKFRYPSPGQHISKINVTIYEYETDSTYSIKLYDHPDLGNDTVLGKCIWADNMFIYTVYNRSQSERTFYGWEFTETGTGGTNYTFCNHKDNSGQWIDPTTSPTYVTYNVTSEETVETVRAVIDVWDAYNDYCSIGMFTLTNNSEVQYLLSNETFRYDVKSIEGYDKENHLLYFIAAYPDPNQRQILSVNITDSENNCLPFFFSQL